MRYLIGLTLLIILLSPHLVSAQNFEFKKINTEIDLEANTEMIFIEGVALEDSSTVSIVLPAKPTDVKTAVPFKIQQTNNQYEIIFTKTISKGNEFNITVDFQTTGLVDKVGDKNLFTFTFRQPVDEFTLNVALPPQSAIVDEGGSLLITRPVRIATDGQRILLEWSKQIISGEEYVVFVQYRAADTGASATPFIIVAVLVAAAILVLRFRKMTKHKLIKDVVNEDEKKIVDYVAKNDEVLQEDLKKHLDWSKTKVSKVIRNLEMKNIIEKKPYKKTNKLRLK